MKEENEEAENPKAWNKVYLFVIVFLIVQIVVYYAFTNYFK